MAHVPSQVLHKNFLPLEISIISHFESESSFEVEWKNLIEIVPQATPFQFPEWINAWWQNYGRGELLILSFREEGRLVGIAPLFFEPDLGKISIVGTGNSDYLDMIAVPELRERVFESLLNFLNQQRSNWEACDFQELRPGSILLPLLCQCEKEWTKRIEEQSRCPVVSLPRTGETNLSACVSRHFIRRYHYYQRRLSKTFRVSYVYANSSNFDETFEVFFRLHLDRQNQKGSGNAMSSSADQNFHRSAAAQLLKLGALRLCRLDLDSEPAGCIYAFSFRGRFYSYLGGFDPRFSSYNLGSVLIGKLIEDAIDEGAYEFDFLRGQESYKYHWGAKDRTNFRCRLFSE